MLDEMVSRLCDAILREKEKLVKESIALTIGYEPTRDQYNEMARDKRILVVTDRNSRIETFYFDGEPIIEIHPFTSGSDGLTLSVSQKYRRLK